VVQIPLGPGEEASCDRSAMVYHSDGVTVRAKFNGFMSTFQRVAGGGALFSVTYTNNTGELGYVSFSPNVPGIVCPIDMTEYPCILCSRDSFLCSNGGPEETVVKAQINPTSALGCLFSGKAMCCLIVCKVSLNMNSYKIVQAKGLFFKKLRGVQCHS